MSDNWKDKVKSRISDEQKEIDQFKNDRKVILDKVTKAVYEVYDLTGVKIYNLFLVSDYLTDHPVKDELGVLGARNAEYGFSVFYDGSNYKFSYHEFRTALNENYKKHSWLGYFKDFY